MPDQPTVDGGVRNAATSDRWKTPEPVTDVDVAFPARAMEIMPTPEECATGLAAMPDTKRRAWLAFQSQWFSRGLSADVKFHLKPGVDGNTAVRHLRVIQGSYAPKHEHKQVAVAYLASLWFTEVPS